jgi:hypothetical protein
LVVVVNSGRSRDRPSFSKNQEKVMIMSEKKEPFVEGVGDWPQDTWKQAGEAVRRLSMGGHDYEAWMAIGTVLEKITGWVMEELELDRFDPNNKRLVKGATAIFNEWWKDWSHNTEPPVKEVRSALRDLMAAPEVRAWRNNLPWDKAIKLNHPMSILRAYRRSLGHKKQQAGKSKTIDEKLVSLQRQIKSTLKECRFVEEDQYEFTLSSASQLADAVLSELSAEEQLRLVSELGRRITTGAASHE